MAAATLLSLFPKPGNVLALTPEDFGGVIIELRPPLLQNGMFNPGALIAQVDASYRATFCRRCSPCSWRPSRIRQATGAWR
jgi:hypothetical protein